MKGVRKRERGRRRRIKFGYEAIKKLIGRYKGEDYKCKTVAWRGKGGGKKKIPEDWRTEVENEERNEDREREREREREYRERKRGSLSADCRKSLVPWVKGLQ